MTKAKYDPEASKAWGEEAFRAGGLDISIEIQDADNRANLYYFDNKRLLAFHWRGDANEQVEVSYGGDHESPSWSFAAADHDRGFAGELPAMRPVGICTWFGQVCERWIAAMEDAR